MSGNGQQAAATSCGRGLRSHELAGLFLSLSLSRLESDAPEADDEALCTQAQRVARLPARDGLEAACHAAAQPGIEDG